LRTAHAFGENAPTNIFLLIHFFSFPTNRAACEQRQQAIGVKQTSVAMGVEHGVNYNPQRASTKMCEECDRLWREHREVAQKSFRLEERLRNAELCQDNDLANALAKRMGYLGQEQARTSQG
jgi:hypothetical protein